MGEFSHLWYDEDTKTLFMYFNNCTIQNLGEGDDVELKECCLHLDPQTYEKMRNFFINNPKPPYL